MTDPEGQDEPLQRLREAVGRRYEVQGEIDRGGMAIVYRGRDLIDDRAVAIKVLRDELRTHVAELRFLREIQLATQLQHRNIVPLLDSGRGDRLLYYTMPLVEGESLAARLERVQNLPIPEALDIARQVADALAYAHGMGVIHRDVKPQNILLSSDRALLADFGVARAVTEAGGDSLTQSGVTVGTTAYMSPEQAGRSRHVDGRADIYSLGCVLYEMLAGEPPFTGPSAQVVLARHLAEPPPSLSVARPTVSTELQTLVETALAKDAADRFRDAAAFAEALAQVAAGRRYRRWPPVVPKRWRIALSAAAAAGVAVAWLATRGEAHVIDSNKVVVFPLVERSLIPSDSGAGADVALMIGAALEHTEPLRWLDGWRELDEPQRAAAGGVTARSARRITRGRGARFFIDGAVRRAEDSIAVVLRLHDAVADSVVSQETASAAAGSAPYHRLGLSAMNRLLPSLLDPGRSVDLALITERAPAAIAFWMQGERLYRRSQFAQALRFYQRAVAEDSGFAFAASKGIQAAIWEHRSEEARQLAATARARATALPPRYGLFASAVEAYLDGRADTAVARFREALAASPDWAEAWTGLGEVFHHLLPSVASPDSLAEASFAAAWRADSGFTPPLVHLVEISLRAGNTKRARILTRALPDSAIDRTLANLRTLLRACVEAGREAIDWRAAVDKDLHSALLAAKDLSGAAAQPGCAEDGFRALLDAEQATPAYRWSALLGLQGLMIAQGRHSEAAALLDGAVAAGTSQALYLYVFDVMAGAPLHEQAARIEAAARQRFGADYRGASPHVRCLLGVWHATRGDPATARRLHGTLVAATREHGGRRVGLLAAVLAAHIALAESDTADAIRRLRALVPNAPRDSLVWDQWEPLAAERHTLAHLLLTRGSYQEAHDIASVFDHPQPVAFLPFLASSLAIRLQSASALGRSDLVARYQARLRRLGRTDLTDPQP